MLEGYTLASLPAPGHAGRLVKVAEHDWYVDTGTKWIPVEDHMGIAEDYKSGKMALFFKVASYMFIAVGILSFIYWLF